MAESEGSLRALIRRRGTFKAKLTLFDKYLEEFESLDDDTRGRTKVLELEQRTNNAETLLAGFDEVQSDIECEVDDFDEQYAERQEFQDKYYSLLSRAKCLLQNFDDERKSTSSSDRVVGKAAALEGIKLPEIKLPKFDGSYENWMEFRDVFESMINNNIQINNIQKYHYLRASLTGTAQSVIQSFDFTHDNYSIAWSTLCDRFNNTELLVQNHLKAICGLEIVGNVTSGKIRHFYETYLTHLSNLKRLGETTESWDTLLIYILKGKLDKGTASEWQRYKSNHTTVTLKEFTECLKKRANLLETFESNMDQNNDRKNNTSKTNSDNHRYSKPRNYSRTFVTHNDACTSNQNVNSKYVCYLCKGDHTLFYCPDFHNMAVKDRVVKAKSMKVCLNCLKKNHTSADCRWSGCKICNMKHNTMLHVSSDTAASSAVTIAQSNSAHVQENVELMNQDSVNTIHCTLATAKNGITANIPDVPIDSSYLNIPVNIQLADPDFDTPQSIDILIGANAFWDLLSQGRISLGAHLPVLHNTHLGWVIAGAMDIPVSKSHCNLSTNIAIQDQLTKFWEVEEVGTKKPWSVEENLCEEHFLDNLTTSEEGRYVVSIPLKDSPTKLGESRDIAVKRFISLERRLTSSETFRELYTDFLNQYEKLGHMTEVTNDEANVGEIEYFMPHHGVLKESSCTTKLRVVFNASAPTTTGLSLNDLQMTGPIIQQDLLSIILRFRMRSIVLSSDIKMMYRQVLINPNQRNLQKIVWRSNPNEPLKTFQLNTVTYGTTAASFLAIRCLHQLAYECEVEHPNIAKIIRNDMYVDDLLTCVDTEQEANYIISHITQIFLQRGFELRKWKSNDKNVLSDIDIEHTSNIVEFSANKDHETKTLGLFWKCDQDILTYKINVNNSHSGQMTKRIILSKISTIFDPLGLVSPCIITAKDYQTLNAKRELPNNSKILNLHPFMDDQGILRVGATANMSITWHFIPTNSPHFGGIWEAGVKSLKHHLKRVMGCHSLFFFDFQTLLIRIEAVLNSRPLSPMSASPDDLTPLTPSHFLIGKQAVSLPEPLVSSIPENCLSNYQLLLRLYEHFWLRWSREYISELQLRQRWKQNYGQLEKGQLVLVKDDNLPPTRWRLGRVEKLILGKDGIARVASLRTSDGIICRALARLCPLPVVS
nr:unnamed protein product [Callosobruchus chinensis]